MPSDQTHETTPGTDGPALLTERPIGGILVHFLAIPTGVVGAAIMYLLATNEFTKQNARNALDWHLTVLATTVVTFGSLVTYAEVTGQGLTDIVVLPTPVTAAASLGISVLFMLWMVVMFWTFVVGFIAMGKAIFGSTWRYPLSPAFVDRFGSRVDWPEKWPALILVNVISTPLIIWAVFFGTTNDAAFWFSAVGLLALITVLIPLTGVGMYLHGEHHRSPDTDWQPPLVAYLGVPAVIAIFGFVLLATVTDSVYPTGDAMYVFIAAFWISSLVYLVRWWTTMD
ncbi:DUF4870 domain-containing protein [Halosimplex pelagicum]|uniref:DUF4870 domain-containing protein n=1 Tax=Halosimplex pelagicum TaxID=869886 RepID=A0A7D5P8J0_9EURY|nr:DUF4870 domain-containing protein [Halosimplex pelagicum]QLH81364.1 DUF4870 domain-containing protein [Halosimplex pelagicum]